LLIAAVVAGAVSGWCARWDVQWLLYLVFAVWFCSGFVFASNGRTVTPLAKWQRFAQLWMQFCGQATIQLCYSSGSATSVLVRSQNGKVLPTRKVKQIYVRTAEGVSNGRPTPHVKPSSLLFPPSRLTSISDTLAEPDQCLESYNQLTYYYGCYLNDPPADNRWIASMGRGEVALVRTGCGVLCCAMVSVLQRLSSVVSKLAILEWPILMAIKSKPQVGILPVESTHDAYINCYY